MATVGAFCTVVGGIYPLAEDLSQALIKTVDKTYATLQESKCTKLKQSPRLINAEHSLRDVIEQATPFIYCIRDLYYYFEKEDLESIKTAFGNGDAQPLNLFVYRMQQKLNNINKAHQILSEQCEVAQRNCEEAANACCECQAKENTRKRFAKVAGVLSTVGVVTGGIAASAAAGVLTMGVGTVVGVTATAATAGATVAATASSAGVTWYAVSKFDKAEAQFRDFSKQFLDIKSQLVEIDRQAIKARGNVDSYARNLNSLEYLDKHTYNSVCATLDRLSDTARELRPKATEIMNNINTCAEKMSNS